MTLSIIDQGSALAQLTPEQLSTVIETIASEVATMRDLIMRAMSDDEPDLYLDAARIIATSIGVKADSAVGCSIHGDANHWNYGPNFAAVGKAVQA